MNIWRQLFGGPEPEPVSPKRLDYLNEALALERQGDYTAALTSYRLGLRDNPRDPRILQNMAIAFTKTGQPDEANRHPPRDPRILQNMAIAFTKTGQPDEAIRHYRRALELDPTLCGAPVVPDRLV